MQLHSSSPSLLRSTGSKPVCRTPALGKSQALVISSPLGIITPWRQCPLPAGRTICQAWFPQRPSQESAVNGFDVDMVPSNNRTPMQHVQLVVQRTAMALLLVPALLVPNMLGASPALAAARRTATVTAAPTTTEVDTRHSAVASATASGRDGQMALGSVGVGMQDALNTIREKPQVAMATVASLAFATMVLYMATRQPDPANSSSAADKEGSIDSYRATIAVLPPAVISGVQVGGSSSVATSTASSTAATNKAAAPAATPAAAAARSPSPEPTAAREQVPVASRTASAAASSKAATASAPAALVAAPAAAIPAAGTPAVSVPQGRASSRPTSPGRSAEPGVLAVGITAAAMDVMAPVGRFVVGDVMPAMLAAARSTSPEPRAASPAAGLQAVVPAAAAPAAPPTPLQLNPVYLSKPAPGARPMSLSASFRSAQVGAGVAGAAGGPAAAAQAWAAPMYASAPFIAPLSSEESEAAAVSSVVAHNLAVTLAAQGVASDVATPAPVQQLAFAQLDDGTEPVSRTVTRNLAAAALAAAAAIAAAAAAPAPKLQPPAVIPSSKAAAAAPPKGREQSPQLVPRIVPAASPAASAAAAVRPQSSLPDGSVVFTEQQLRSVDVVVEQVRVALNSRGITSSKGSSSNTNSADPDTELVPLWTDDMSATPTMVAIPKGKGGSPQTRQQQLDGAISRWSTMINKSPTTAADAVAELQAVASVVAADVGKGKGGSSASAATGGGYVAPAEPGPEAAAAELAAATSSALARGGKQPGWMWAWAWALPGMPSFLDPIKSLISLAQRTPTVRSKYDPLAGLSDITPPAYDDLPFWDPLHRFRKMKTAAADQQQGAAAAPRIPSKLRKYDGIAQLIDFMAALPELVSTAEWARGSENDYLRQLLADAAGRNPRPKPPTTYAVTVPRVRSRWSKYDPLASFFAPDGPQGARWDEVVSQMLSLEAVVQDGPMVARFSPSQIMSVRGGQAFQSAMSDFKRVAVDDDGAARLQRDHAAVATWLQAAGNVALATAGAGSKLGPVWSVLLLPQHADTLSAAKAGLPAFTKDIANKRYGGLSGLLQGREPAQALLLLATLSSWVVGEELAAKGRAPRSLSPPPPDVPPKQVVTVSAGKAQSSKQ